MNEGPSWGDVDHRYICFGNYPQSEITGDKLTDSIINASYDKKGDSYINGIKYKRISKKNSTYVNTTVDDYLYLHFDDDISYYNWSDGGYRYFKYEPIIWRVLENNNGELTLLSEYCLDCQIVGESDDKISWENSSLRQWLNNNFINTAITKNNQRQIIKTKLTTAANAEYRTLKCSDTEDQVFILGIDDICNSKYGLDNSKNDFNSRAYCTTYAKAMGAGTVNDEGGSCCWWLRNRLDNGLIGEFLIIKYNGRTYYGCSSNDKIVGVRHAININSSLVAEYCYTKDELKNEAKNSPIWTDPTHKYIYFGCYPDSEVKKNDLKSEILNASYDSNGDAVINEEKYRRIDLSNDIFPWWQYSDYFYDWSEPGYRYFIYEPIKWRVLSNSNGELFLLSEKSIDCQAYNFRGYSIIEESLFYGVDNQDDSKIAWENCSLRNWLNNNFIHSAFSQEAQLVIKTTMIDNSGNSSFSTISDSNTEDKAIILSSNDALNSNYGFRKDCVWDRNYYNDEYCDQCRIAIASDYAWAMGSSRWTNGANSDNWWLRDNEGMTALVVGVSGTIEANHVKYSFNGVRPAIIIDSNRICGN